MKRSVLNLLGGLLLCLPMLFTSCSEKDNALEQIVNQPNLEGLQKALYKNAEVTIEFISPSPTKKSPKPLEVIAFLCTIKNKCRLVWWFRIKAEAKEYFELEYA